MNDSSIDIADTKSVYHFDQEMFTCLLTIYIYLGDILSQGSVS